MGFVVKQDGLWPGGKIYFEQEGKVTADPSLRERFDIMITTMRRWEELVERCILFVDVTGYPRYTGVRVVLTKGSLGEGLQTIAGCVGRYKGNAIAEREIKVILNADIHNYPHEVGHIIGLGHEHMRPDAGLKPKKAGDFFAEAQMRNEQSKCDPSGPYDPQSIMHYQGGSIKARFTIPDEWGQYQINDKRTAAEVRAGSWNLSIGDKKTVMQLYAGCRPVDPRGIEEHKEKMQKRPRPPGRGGRRLH